MRPRRLFAALHRYVGLCLLLLVVQASLTGSVLSFGHEFDRLLGRGGLGRFSRPALPDQADSYSPGGCPSKFVAPSSTPFL